MSELSAPNANFLEPTFGRATMVWWAFMWRALVFGVGAGFVVGFVEGVIGVLLKIATANVRMVAQASGLLVAIPISIYAVQLVLRKRFGEFTIRLQPTKTEPSF